MQTLVAAADPANVKPIIMIVDSTPKQRAAWHLMCQIVHVRHHFVGVDSALGRLAEGFAVAGVVLDHDLAEGTAITAEKFRFLQELMKLSYSGPLVGANLHPDGQQQFMLLHVAIRLGIPLLLDDNPDVNGLGYSDILRWCADHH
ncbi:MAG TPA: hypothetical protein VFT59_00425 [Candidatus Saccharimonadales bacterium]|nr:hypothetical protein [Candidatus Saccharimonadales bacterium]